MPLDLPDGLVREALDPVGFVHTRVSDGSIAPNQIRRLTSREAANLERDRQWMDDTHARLKHAAHSLHSAAHELSKSSTQ
jgi:argininosuccinate lyase